MSAKIEASITVNNIDEVRKGLQGAVNIALEAIGLQAESYAKIELEKPKEHSDGTVRPTVDTGRLVNSITHAVENETTVAIGTNVEYAAYVEMGTSRMKAQPYLEPAVMDHTSEYQDIVERYLRNS